MQGRALGRPEWSVCASFSTLQVKEKASWLFTIDRTWDSVTRVQSNILRSRQTTVCPIWTTSKTRQILETVGLSEEARLSFWDSGIRSFRGRAAVREQKSAAPMLTEQAGALSLSSKASLLIDGCLPTRAPCRFLERYQSSISYQQLKASRGILRCRPSALGGYIEVCHDSGFETGISYNLSLTMLSQVPGARTPTLDQGTATGPTPDQLLCTPSRITRDG